MPIQDIVLQFTLLIAITLIMQLTVERTHLPGLIGLLIAGMVIGPGGLGLLPREPVVELFGTVGLVYIMFLAGVEMDLDIVRASKRDTTLFGVLSFLFCLIPALVLGLALGYGLQVALLLGALLSSHTLLAYPVLRRLGLIGTRATVTAVGGTLVTDTLALILLAVTIGTAGNTAGPGLHITLPLLAVIAGVALWTVPRLSNLFFAKVDATQAERALFVLAVLLAFATIAELIGSEPILGAFLAGVCLNRPLKARPPERDHVIFAGRMLFIPIFFVSTGMLLPLQALVGQASVWAMAGLLLLVVVFGKATASWLIGWMAGFDVKERLLIFSLTIPQAAATLAVTLVAYEAGLFDDIILDAVVLLIFFTCLAGPILTQRIGRKVHRSDRPSE